MGPGDVVFPGSAEVSDACDDLGVNAVRIGGFRSVLPDRGPVFGRISTLTLVPDSGCDPLPELLADLAAIPAGQIALIDLGGHVDLQSWGSRTACVARQAGLAGALVNGSVRDVAMLRALEFPTFALGSHPTRARGRLRYVGAGRDVVFGNHTVPSGSIAAIDDSGAVFFPEEASVAVLAKARELSVDELPWIFPRM